MKTQYKALAVVAMMVAVGFAFAIPALSSDNGSDGAKWTGDDVDVQYIGTYSYSYKVILPMSSAAFALSGTIDSGKVSVNTTATEGKYASGSTVTVALDASTTGKTLIITASYPFSSETSEGTITFTQVTLSTSMFNIATGSTMTDAIVGNEYNKSVAATSLPTGVTSVTYSAVGLPAGLTMEADGKIYGSPNAASAAANVTLYAQANNGYVESITVSLKAVAPSDATISLTSYTGDTTDDTLVVLKDGVYYTHSDVTNMVFTASDGFTVTKVASIAGLSMSVVDGTLKIASLGNTTGEVTINVQVTETSTGVTSNVAIVIYSIPANGFLTTPEGGMQIGYA